MLVEVDINRLRPGDYVVRRDDSCGFCYGVSFIACWVEVYVPNANANAQFQRQLQPHWQFQHQLQPHWWAACRNCKRPALLLWRELSTQRQCVACIKGEWLFATASEILEDHRVDRRFMPLDFMQEAACSAFLVGGYEAVCAMLVNKQW